VEDLGRYIILCRDDGHYVLTGKSYEELGPAADYARTIAPSRKPVVAEIVECFTDDPPQPRPRSSDAPVCYCVPMGTTAIWTGSEWRCPVCRSTMCPNCKEPLE